MQQIYLQFFFDPTYILAKIEMLAQKQLWPKKMLVKDVFANILLWKKNSFQKI